MTELWLVEENKSDDFCLFDQSLNDVGVAIDYFFGVLPVESQNVKLSEDLDEILGHSFKLFD
jgi:hypothetical protein